MSRRPLAVRRFVTLVTPEQVPIGFELAPLGSRLAALLVDLGIIVGLVALLALLTTLLGGALQAVGGGGIVQAVVILAGFLLFNFYFILAELRWQGRTPGKRLIGIRVVARDGGPLTAGLVFARNLTRDFEIWLPIQLLASGQGLLGAGAGLVGLLSMAWLVIVVLLPVFNRHRMRLGDLVAGTLVVVSPRARLLRDLAAEAPTAAGGPSDAPELAFTREQLDVYGIRELQVLEDVLRREPEQQDPELLALIRDKVMRKIDWPDDRRDVDPERFLRAFYAAQRGRLEREMLFGRRRERKLR
ncbi:MAG: RDD family protein [Myxococcota bacterium]